MSNIHVLGTFRQLVDALHSQPNGVAQMDLNNSFRSVQLVWANDTNTLLAKHSPQACV